MFGFIADVISVIHYVWVGVSLVMLAALLVMSGILLFRRRAVRLRRIGLISSYVLVGWAVLTLGTQLILGGCPLTSIENELRAAENPYFVPMESFLVTACQRFLGWDVAPEFITHLTFTLFGLSVVLLTFFLVLSAGAVRRMSRDSKKTTGTVGDSNGTA